MEENSKKEESGNESRHRGDFSERIEEEIERASKVIEEKAQEIGRKIESEFRGGKKSEHSERRCHHSAGNFWGVVLIIFGFIFLAENLRWIDWNIPFWPLLLIVVGAYLIYDKRRDD
ncbi:hypothetical protein ISS30_06975 [bacterium]|nr:hypothetical protein [FCB group bacterium]MBL7191422.1 hypothetical protein [bacterium]